MPIHRTPHNKTSLVLLVILVLLSDWFYQPESVVRLVYSIGINPGRPAMFVDAQWMAVVRLLRTHAS